jgi:hypothetical protein
MFAICATVQHTGLEIDGITASQLGPHSHILAICLPDLHYRLRLAISLVQVQSLETERESRNVSGNADKQQYSACALFFFCTQLIPLNANFPEILGVRYS